jgi:hypothetical protein
VRSDEEWVTPYVVQLAGNVVVLVEGATREEVLKTVRVRSVEWGTTSKVLRMVESTSGKAKPKGERIEPRVIKRP